MSKGTVVIDGHRYAVTGVTLHGGKILITAWALGPQPGRHGVHACTVFGDDGTGIYQAEIRFDHPPCSRGDDMTVICPVRVAEIIPPASTAGPR